MALRNEHLEVDPADRNWLARAGLGSVRAVLKLRPNSVAAISGSSETFSRSLEEIEGAPPAVFIKRYRYTLNPYGGCCFACEYCYARSFAPTVAKQDGWGGWVSVKRNAAALIAKACRSGELESGDAVYMSSATDPNQPFERHVELTRSILQTLIDHGVQPRLTIQTRAPLVVRDIDLLRRFDRLRVNITIGTDSDEVRRRYEPRCPSIARRLEAAATLRDAGIRIGVSISPMLPLEDVERFGARLAALDAEEYVAQYFHPLRPGYRFAASSTAKSFRLAREDR